MKITEKIIFSLASALVVVLFGFSSASATVSGPYNIGGSNTETGLTIVANNCDPLTVSNGTVAAYPACTITCNSGYVLSGSTCVASGGGGGGGGGGGSSTPSCTSVTYSDWQSTCYSGQQFRSVVSRSPENCSLTTSQQLAAQRTCQLAVAATTTPPTTAGTPTSDTVLENILNESQIVSTNNTDTLLSHLGNSTDASLEQSGLTKYKTILGLDKTITNEEKLTINDFIVYGTRSTQRLGAGERAAVINSYYQAYKKLPNSEAEWSDVLKIASGRWPSERSATAEAQAKIEFKKVYARNAVMTNNIDENAIMIIAYGLLPLNRNLKSEQTAIKTFKWVYGHAPVNALAWNVVRAIAYSGAKR